MTKSMKNYHIVQFVRIILFIGLVTVLFRSAFEETLEASASPSQSTSSNCRYKRTVQ